jgi:hypothetical protein
MKIAAIYFYVALAVVSVRAQPQEARSQSKLLYSVNQYTFENHADVSFPLHGRIEFANTQSPASNLIVEGFTTDGKARLGSTKTNQKGRFSFPQLKEGEYLLETRGEHVDRIVASDSHNIRSYRPYTG